MRHGTIIGFRGTWSSGIAHLIIKNEKGEREEIACDNAQTVRSLDAAFGNVIGCGRTMREESIKGQKIEFAMTAWNTMEGFNQLGKE